jgi:hypothetical protein
MKSKEDTRDNSTQNDRCYCPPSKPLSTIHSPDSNTEEKQNQPKENLTHSSVTLF